MGEIVGHVKEFLQTLIDLAATRRRRQLEEEQLEEEVQKARIENARALVGLAQDLGYSNVKIREMVGWVDDRQAKVLPLVVQGKIRAVRLLDKGPVERENIHDQLRYDE